MITTLLQALSASKRIDDRARSIDLRRSVDASSLIDQERIDAALSDRESVPWTPPSPTVRHAVLKGIQDRRAQRAAARRSRGISGLVLAALFVSFAGFVLSPAGEPLREPIRGLFAHSQQDQLSSHTISPTPTIYPQAQSGTLNVDAISAELDAVREDAARAARAIVPGSGE